MWLWFPRCKRWILMTGSWDWTTKLQFLREETTNKRDSLHRLFACCIGAEHTCRKDSEDCLVWAYWLVGRLMWFLNENKTCKHAYVCVMFMSNHEIFRVRCCMLPFLWLIYIYIYILRKHCSPLGTTLGLSFLSRADRGPCGTNEADTRSHMPRAESKLTIFSNAETGTSGAHSKELKRRLGGDWSYSQSEKNRHGSTAAWICTRSLADLSLKLTASGATLKAIGRH